MSILGLTISFLLSLFKSQRQLVLANLALRQQVTMLRQSVEKPVPGRPAIDPALRGLIRDMQVANIGWPTIKFSEGTPLCPTFRQMSYIR